MKRNLIQPYLFFLAAPASANLGKSPATKWKMTSAALMREKPMHSPRIPPELAMYDVRVVLTSFRKRRA